MAESVTLRDKVNEINDSESETHSVGTKGTSDEEDNDHTVDTGAKKLSVQQAGSGSRMQKRRNRSTKRSRDDSEGDGAGDDGMKRNERRAANRLSAFQSRQRRKSIISDLQKTVAQLSKDGDEQRKKNREKVDELKKLRKENELLHSQILGGGSEAIQAPSGSQKIDASSVVPGLKFPMGSNSGRPQIQDPLLLASGLSSNDLSTSNSARAQLSLGLIPDQLRQQYLSLTQIADSASSPVNTQDQMMGLLTLLSQIGSAPNSNPNVTQFGGSYASSVQNQASQPNTRIEAAQMQQLLELLRLSNGGNLR